ncbi:MAG: phosphatase PAP2 family protein [Chlamydiales bacterium]|nr:phosphatase PAP2 family protein [Chlamydiales bacterium]MBY0529844.1 phosphatase PAP2 family protein [Rhabdochlamydiaceae bacterium]
MFLDAQLQWIRKMQHLLRSPWLDALFKAWDYVDKFFFAVIVISLIMYLWDRQKGIRLLYLLLLSMICNKLLKSLFHDPRPCQIDPSVGLICHSSYGLPSGAAQSATLYFGFICLECKRPLYRYLAFVFALLLCFSRIYLGVHYPTDILGGIIVGSILLLIYCKVFPLFQNYWKIAAFTFPFVVFLVGRPLSEGWAWYLLFSTMGLACGLLSEDRMKLPVEKRLKIRILQVVAVIGGLSLLQTAKDSFPCFNPIWNFGVGYWLSFLGGWMVQKIALIQRRP